MKEIESIIICALQRLHSFPKLYFTYYTVCTLPPFLIIRLPFLTLIFCLSPYFFFYHSHLVFICLQMVHIGSSQRMICRLQQRKAKSRLLGMLPKEPVSGINGLMVNDKPYDNSKNIKKTFSLSFFRISSYSLVKLSML
jgi:hypothetical protein